MVRKCERLLEKNISMINHEYIAIYVYIYKHIHNKYLERCIMYTYYAIVHINEQTQLHSITSSNTMLDENNNLMARSCMYRQLRPGYEEMHWLPRHRPNWPPRHHWLNASSQTAKSRGNSSKDHDVSAPIGHSHQCKESTNSGTHPISWKTSCILIWISQGPNGPLH